MDTTNQTILERVEKLLAKAESSEHESERDAYVTKAQELMTKYAIDEAMLRQSQGVRTTITSVSLDVGNVKYSKARAQLAFNIANANNCYAVAWRKLYPERGYDRIEVFGTPTACELVETLWASLNTQLNVALEREEIPSHVQGKTFRNNFVRAYAYTVGQRLKEAKENVVRGEAGHSTALVLVNVRNQAEDYAKDFHSDKSIVNAVDRYKGNSEGWGAGKRAGQNASLARGQLN